MLGGGTLFPVHWGTFSLGLHAWDAPGEELLELAPRYGARFLTPRLGEAFEPAHIEGPRRGGARFGSQRSCRARSLARRRVRRTLPESACKTTEARKVVVHEAGGHEKLKVEAASVPAPGQGAGARSTSRRSASTTPTRSCGWACTRRAKEYVGWPITPGFEVAGTVGAVGEGVTDLAVGTPVFAVTRFGGYASHVVVDRAYVFAMPAALTFEQAAALPTVYMTAWYALFELAHPRRGAKVLVHSAAGGVGSALVQMAKRAGCEVTGVVGRTAKVEVVEGARRRSRDRQVDAGPRGTRRSGSRRRAST